MKRRLKIRLQPKLLLGLIIMAVILLLGLAPTISQLYRARMEEFYSDQAFQQAAIAAEVIDGDAITRYYTTGEKDAYYDEVRQYLSLVKQQVGLKYYYVVVPEEDVYVYIWDSGDTEDAGVCDLLDKDEYYGGGKELMHAAFRVDAERSILVTNNEVYGYVASAFVPILDSTGTPVALASVDISMDLIDAQIRQFRLVTLGVVLSVLLLSVIFYYFYVRRILIHPLDILHRETMGLVQNKMENLAEFTVDVETGDEVQDLADTFEYMVHELDEYIRNLSAVTKEKERIGAELDVARNIQASMLPGIFPAFPTRKEFDIYATMTPAKEVGGDFYDFFLVDEDHLALVIADVSGKGVPAALFMMISKTLIKSSALNGLSPKEVLEQVNDQLCENNEAGMFVTVWLGILEISTGRMKCTNAGHEFPVIRRKSGGYELFKDRHGLVLAGMEGSRYREYDLDMDPGDRLFIYTDGVPEATDSSLELYGTERMLAALNRAGDASCEALLEAVHADVNAFVGEAPQFDDLTMLCLELKNTAERP